MRRLRFFGVLAAGTVAIAAVPALAEKMSMPTVTVDSPAAGSTVTTQDIPVSLTAKNFRVECADVGKPGVPGQGHVHAMLDGMSMANLTNVVCGDHFAMSSEGIKPGEHTLSVMLASDDHMPASMPAMVKFTY